jgi:tetratricopeptide (TPR) repeat protein
MAALLAHALSGLGELDEAERFSRTSEDVAASDDAFSQVLWRTGRAKIRARRGELAEAEALAREAVAVAERTDLLNTRGDTLADLGEIVALAGRPADAVAAFEQAAELFERKGNRASLERVRLAVADLDIVTVGSREWLSRPPRSSTSPESTRPTSCLHGTRSRCSWGSRSTSRCRCRPRSRGR